MEIQAILRIFKASTASSGRWHICSTDGEWIAVETRTGQGPDNRDRWVARSDYHEPGMPVGHGPTEAAAVINFLHETDQDEKFIVG